MSILEKEVRITYSNKTYGHYESLGYIFPETTNKNGDKIKRGSKILVKIKDLTKGCSVKVTKVCDDCGDHVPNISHAHLLNNRESGDGRDRCKKCYNKKGTEVRRKNYIEKNGCVADTHPEFAKLLWDQEDAYTNTYNSDTRVDFRCPNCNCKINNKVLSSIFNSGLSCPRCSDGKSYPEKFVAELLCQLKVDFESQRKFRWSKNKIYDFYIKEFNCIIEVHGKQHYSGGFVCYGVKGKSSSEEQENDKLKKDLALKNNITNYIEIDASDSSIDYIKNSIVNSKLNIIFNLNDIKWGKCHSFACDTLIKTACDLWNKGFGTTSDIGRELKLNCNTIAGYLKIGNEIGWCKYDPTESKLMVSKYGNKFSREVVQLTTAGDFVSAFDSIREAGDEVRVTHNNISMVCRGKQKTAGGYKWMYKEDYKNLLDNKCNVEEFETLNKPVVQLNADREIIAEYDSIKQAAIAIGDKAAQNIGKCCNGKQKTAYGFKWMFRKEYIKYKNII